MQPIPIQIQWLLPAATHDDERDWLWLSRLACHFKRAPASGPPPTLFPVAEEAKAVDSIEKTNARTMKNTSETWNGRNWLGSFFATKDIVIVCLLYKDSCWMEGRRTF